MLNDHLQAVTTATPPFDFFKLTQHLPLQWLEEALQSTGKASVRKRKLPAEQVVWLVIALALYRHQSIPEVVEHLQLVLPAHGQLGEVAKSALSQARQRLGDNPLAQLFSMSAAAWDEQIQASYRWRGLACYAMDGTTLRAPDSPENRATFGAQAYASGVVSSYPQIRAVSLTATASHLVRAAVFGEYGKNEMRYARDLLPEIPDHSLTVFDKGFLSAEILLGLSREGVERHWLIPARTNLRWDVVAGSAGDCRVRMKVSAQARQQNPALPSHWEARAIETQSRSGKRRTLLTSLIDPAYPATELVERYNERWRIEVSYRELKQNLLGEVLTLRSRTPETARQEVWGALLAYNLIRLEMAEVAGEAKVAPTELSFIRALHYLQHEWSWFAVTAPGKLPQHLQLLRRKLAAALLPQTRRGRECPRVVKALPRRYAEKKVGKP